MGLLSRLTRPRKYYAKYTLTIGDHAYCHIGHDFTNSITPAKAKILYIESMLLFLNRYFFIVDAPQRQPMKAILLDYIDEPDASFESLMSAVEGMIFNSLSEAEKKNLAAYTSRGGVLPAFLSPDLPTAQAGKYEIYIVRRGSSFDIKFFMKLSADKIILSRLPVLMLEYIESNLDKKSIQLLRTRIKLECLSKI